jgi:glucose/arabinose dehydrogenase
MSRLTLTAATALLLAACGGSNGTAQPAASGAPVQTAPANAPDYKPAFAGQTRAPEMKSNVAYQVTTVADGLDKPWGLAFLPNGSLLITEKPGRLRVLENGKLSEPVAGVPAVDNARQGGLLGLAVDPNYARNGFIYMSFSEPHPNGFTNTAVARGRLVSATGAAPRLEDVQVIWRQTPSLDSKLHYGGRLVFRRDGTLFVTTGERSVLEGRMQAQRTDGTLGKVVRINTDGSVPKDNPFVGRPGVKPEIWSIGQRNMRDAPPHDG